MPAPVSLANSTKSLQIMSSRIEQIIEEIEEYIDSCKFQALSTSKIIVNKDQMDELLRELRMKTPDDISSKSRDFLYRSGAQVRIFKSRSQEHRLDPGLQLMICLSHG